jgi:succinylglutamic semialdehyde dehydrogenase
MAKSAPDTGSRTRGLGRLLRKGDYVHGSFLKPEKVDGYLNAVNPGDRTDVLGRFSFSESSAREAVDMAQAGARTWRRTPLQTRAAMVRVFRDHLARFQERLAILLTRETGKPIWESRQEILATIRGLDLHLDDGMAMLAPRIIDDIGARSDRIGRGVVAIIAPFNFPMLVGATQVAAAILAGNAVVLKPSKFTPGMGQAIASLWDRCGLPRGVFNMVQGPGSVIGQAILQHPGLDMVLFTGRHSTARTIQASIADRPELPVVMQTGGKGAAIVLDGAEIDRAVYEIMVGAYLTAGQRHNSTARIIITDGIASEFTAELMRRVVRLEIGHGMDGSNFMGPVISENLRTRYRRFCRRLTSMGHHALIEAGAARCGHRGFYARPALYRIDWTKHDPVLSTEPPGPVLLIYRVRDWQEAAALHNQLSHRLATSIFADPSDPDLPELRQRIRTGALNINRGTIGASMRLPAQGLGRSANGMPTGLEILQVLTHPRAQLEERRDFNTLPSLPGTNWEAPEELDDETEVLDLEETADLTAELETDHGEDLSAALELT